MYQHIYKAAYVEKLTQYVTLKHKIFVRSYQ